MQKAEAMRCSSEICGTTDNVVVDNITMNGGINVFNATNVVLERCEYHWNQLLCRFGAMKEEGYHRERLFSNQWGCSFRDDTSQYGQHSFHRRRHHDADGKPLVLEKNGDTYGKPVIGGAALMLLLRRILRGRASSPSTMETVVLACSHAETEKKM